MLLKWKNEYSCFDNEIDNQHLKLIELINRMDDIAKLNDGYDRFDEIVRIFYDLKNYTDYHFKYEEEQFDKVGYDNISIQLHKNEHKIFIEKVDEINLEDIETDQIKAVNEILIFVSDWLVSHILETDMKFGSFLNEYKMFNT